MADMNSRQRHRSTLKKYLQSHSASRQAECGSHISTVASELKKPISKSRTSLQPTNTSSFKTKSSFFRLPDIQNKTGKDKATIESLPDEILSSIFWRLKVGDLISASKVCHRWHYISEDNLLWKKLYIKFVGATTIEKEDKISLNDLGPGCWRNLCLRRCKVKRDKIYLKKLKHPDPFTGLKDKPELILSQVGTRFELSFKCSDSLSQTILHNNIYWSTMSLTVLWHALVFPDIKDIQCIQIHACSPLMFYGLSKPVKDGFVHKSLLMEYKAAMNDVVNKQKPFGSDTQIQLFELQKGLNVAIYQAGGEIAFVACTLHYHHLISRCLCGNPGRSEFLTTRHSNTHVSAYPILIRPYDDIDPEYGLHGYTCVIVIRNMRQKLLECKYTHLHTNRRALADGFATFNPVRKDDKMSHTSCLKEISFPWKTTLFKGKVKDVAILDITILCDSGEPFWMVTSAVSVTKSTQTNQFEFDSNTYRAIHYLDDVGKIYMEIGKLDDGSQYLCHASISLAVTAINEAFQRSY